MAEFAPRGLDDETAPVAGAIDSVDVVSGISGWAFARNKAQRPLRVELVSEGQVIAVADALLPRPDISGVLGYEVNCGFNIAWSQIDSALALRIAESRSKKVEFLVGDRCFKLTNVAREITLSDLIGIERGGIPFAPRGLDDETAPIAGAIDSVDVVSGISGWAFARNKAQRPLRVELVSEGQMIAAADALLPRPDISSVLGYVANCGFNIAWSQIDSALALRIAESGPKKVEFLVGDRCVKLINVARELTLADIIECTTASQAGLYAEYTLAQIIALQEHFDTHFYRLQNPQVAGTSRELLIHYLSSGWHEGLDPSKSFSTAAYLRLNPDVRRSGMNPLAHFVLYGREQGRPTTPSRTFSKPIPLRALLASTCNVPVTDVFLPELTIVIPVYNNFDDLVQLLSNLRETVPNRVGVSIIDDCSSDERVRDLLRQWSALMPDWQFLANDVNEGFSATVNRGITTARGHVILLNTDVTLPSGWVERLIKPILDDEDRVGTVTALSNNSSLSGFPQLNQEAEIYLGLTVHEVDAEIQKLPPVYVEIPSGVGFCMALNRNAIEATGAFDCDTYALGYYEDTDFCQRAALKGFRNVACCNLFVEHKMGSKSFGVNGRNTLSARNRGPFTDKYPYYESACRNYVRGNPLATVSDVTKLRLWAALATRTTVVVTHAWGGGARMYADQLTLWRPGPELAIELVLDDGRMRLAGRFRGDELVCEDAYDPQVWQFLSALAPSETILNCLHGAQDVVETLRDARPLFQACKLVVPIHDYLSICPSFFLLNNKGIYCGVPKLSICQACFHSNPNFRHPASSIMEWRRAWQPVLQEADEILVFSRSSYAIMTTAFPSLDRSRIRHCAPDYDPAVREASVRGMIEASMRGTIRVAIFGSMYLHKGLEIVLDLAEHIESVISERSLSRHEPNRSPFVEVHHFGEWVIQRPRNIRFHGRYHVMEMPDLIEMNEIDVVLFPSVCPETFSYTLTELFMMRVPVVALEIGAQGERVAAYEFGVVLRDGEPRAIVDALWEAVEKGSKREAVANF